MSKRRNRPQGQGWRTFLRNHLPEIAAKDFFVVPTLGFELLYALVIIHLDRRLIVWSNVTQPPTAEWVARKITEAFPWDETPRYLIRDRDSIFGELVKKRLRAIGIRDKPTAPRSPWQNVYAERMIGSIRHECIDHCIVVSETHLSRLLRSFEKYYNEFLTHQSLGKDSPVSREIQPDGRIESVPILRGLHHHYVRI